MCGLISSRAWCADVFDGAIAMPFEPDGSTYASASPGVAERLGAGSVERLRRVEIHLLDVAADAAFTERQRHPRLEVLDHAWRDVGMLVQVVVEPVRVGIHQLLQPLRTRRVLRLHRIGIDEQLHAQVAPHGALALRLGQPSHGVDVVRLHAIEVVFGLCVHQPEYDVGVGLSVDVRNPPVVANDGHALRAFLPRGNVGRGGRLGGYADGADDAEDKGELLHVKPLWLKGTRENLRPRQGYARRPDG